MDGLEKMVADLTAKVEELTKRVEALESAPAPVAAPVDAERFENLEKKIFGKGYKYVSAPGNAE